MHIIIDRFEGDFAVVELEDSSMINMPILLIPEEAEEGDILEITIDRDEIENRRKNIEKLCEDLWE